MAPTRAGIVECSTTHASPVSRQNENSQSRADSRSARSVGERRWAPAPSSPFRPSSTPAHLARERQTQAGSRSQCSTPQRPSPRQRACRRSRRCSNRTGRAPSDPTMTTKCDQLAQVPQGTAERPPSATAAATRPRNSCRHETRQRTRSTAAASNRTARRARSGRAQSSQ